MEQAKEPVCVECGEHITKSYMLECEHCLSKKED